MTIIAIKEIKEDNVKEVFEKLKTRLPMLPGGLGSFECKNPEMLIVWVNRFVGLYGYDGDLYLEWNTYGQVDGNKKYREALLATCDGVYR